MFNQLKKEEKKSVENLTKARDERCIPIAKKVLNIITESNPLIGSKKSKEVAESYTPIAEKILRLGLEENVVVDDLSYIFRLVLEAVDMTQQFVSESMGKSVDNAQTILWGKEEGKVTFKDLNKVLIEGEK